MVDSKHSIFTFPIDTSGITVTFASILISSFRVELQKLLCSFGCFGSEEGFECSDGSGYICGIEKINGIDDFDCFDDFDSLSGIGVVCGVDNSGNTENAVNCGNEGNSRGFGVTGDSSGFKGFQKKCR